MTSTPTSRRGCAGRRTIGSWTDLSRLMALRKNGSRRHGCFGRQPDSKTMKKTLLIATALTASAYTFSSGATQEAASLLESLPAEVQKDIEETRASSPLAKRRLMSPAPTTSMPPRLGGYWVIALFLAT